jgi:hypothetical protein
MKEADVKVEAGNREVDKHKRLSHEEIAKT